jgi:hypothetical protein
MVDPISAVKEVYAAVQKYNDVPLMKQIVDLQSQMMDQQAELITTKQERRAATEKLSLREKISRRGTAGYFYLDGDNDPLCPVCWERDAKIVHLPQSEKWNGGIRRDCNECEKTHWEVPMSSGVFDADGQPNPW